jgi:hypothetical protein
MYAVLEGSINGVNIEKLPEGAARDGWPRVSACSASPVPRPILGATPLVLTVVVLLLLPAEGLVRGRASRAWIAIRDMMSPPRSSASARYGQTARLFELVLPRYCGCSAGLHLIYTSVVEASALRIERSFQISVRKQVLRAAALTTVKAPFSDRIFREMTGSGGRWRVSMGIFRKGAETLGWAGDVTTQRRNLAVDQLQKQRQGNCCYKLKL